jgi:hypothetical protein
VKAYKKADEKEIATEPFYFFGVMANREILGNT